MKKVYIKDRVRRRGEMQFYMHQFVEAFLQYGVCKKREINMIEKFKIAGLCRHLTFWLYSLFFSSSKKNKAIIITSRGEDLKLNAYPYYLNYEVIPMLWDVWPYCWERLFQDIKQLDVKTVFVTVRSMAKILNEKLGVNAIWVPEGIDISAYKKGVELCQRQYDIYELGRQHKKFHSVLIKMEKERLLSGYYHNNYDQQGKLTKLAFDNNADMIELLSNVKVVVNFPKNDTEPEAAGSIETLTQRYWEAMLSGCLIVGRAPKELLDLLGYDPVVNIDWSNPIGQMRSILSNISNYQYLVDKNYKFALENAPWEARIPDLKNQLNKLNYTF